MLCPVELRPLCPYFLFHHIQYHESNDKGNFARTWYPPAGRGRLWYRCGDALSQPPRGMENFFEQDYRVMGRVLLQRTMNTSLQAYMEVDTR